MRQGGDEATAAARSMMDKMVENGVAHGDVTYNMLIDMLRIEGYDETA